MQAPIRSDDLCSCWFVSFINGFEMSIALLELRPKGGIFISPSKADWLGRIRVREVSLSPFCKAMGGGV